MRQRNALPVLFFVGRSSPTHSSKRRTFDSITHSPSTTLFTAPRRTGSTLGPQHDRRITGSSRHKPHASHTGPRSRLCDDRLRLDLTEISSEPCVGSSFAAKPPLQPRRVPTCSEISGRSAGVSVGRVWTRGAGAGGIRKCSITPISKRVMSWT